MFAHVVFQLKVSLQAHGYCNRKSKNKSDWITHTNLDNSEAGGEGGNWQEGMEGNRTQGRSLSASGVFLNGSIWQRVAIRFDEHPSQQYWGFV